MKMTKTCRSCQIRQIATGTVKGADAAYVDKGTARAVELCNFCHVEADYENTHSDDGHNDDVDGCWICYPELNQRTKADERGTRQATGTSRVGMVITVPLRASGAEKAKVVADRFAGRAKVRTTKGITTLTVADAKLRLVWDAQGRFNYDASRISDRKVRNVAAALRQLGV